MDPIRFSLAQIEAFACVCESGTLTAAAKRLGKDRTTVSELVDYLELDLGYALFDRGTRPLSLTEAGQLLYRQARLFLHEARAFSQLAEHIPQQLNAELTLCYDVFVPRDFLLALTSALQEQHIQLNLIQCERQEGELMLEEDDAELGIFQAVNRSVNERFQWRAVGSIGQAVYAREGFFRAMPVSPLTLASSVQLLPFRRLLPAMAQRLQIADHILRVTELSVLRSLLCAGAGWAFLPTHLQADTWSEVRRITTEMGDEGLMHPVVALWKPENKGQPALRHALETMARCWPVREEKTPLPGERRQ